MKIGIKVHYLPVIHLAINIARYLQLQWESVYFLDSNNFSINYLIKKEWFHIIKYKKSSSNVKIISNQSDIFKLTKVRECIKNDSILIEQLNILYNNSLNTLNESKIDKIILFNWELDIERYVSEKLWIKTWYLDDWHLPDSYQMNLKWPNSKSDYANLTHKYFLKFTYEKNKIKNIKFDINKIKIWIIGYLLWFIKVILDLFKNKFILKKFILIINQCKYLFIKKKIVIEDINYTKIWKYIFFPLQVNNDSQIQINSEWKNNFEILNFITKQIQDTDYSLIIKPHPFEPQKINYSQYHNDKNIFVLNWDLDELITKSDLVITVNSSVWFQAIQKYKKTIILWDCFYKNSPISILHEKDTKLIQSIQKSNLIKVSKIDIDNYINHFKNNIFIRGSARNQNINNLDINFFEDLYKRL